MLLSKAPDQWYGDWIPIPLCLLVSHRARHTGAGPPGHLVPETRLRRFLPACDAHPRPFVLGSLGHCICKSHDVPRRVLLAHRKTLPWRVNNAAHRTVVPRRAWHLCTHLCTSRLRSAASISFTLHDAPMMCSHQCTSHQRSGSSHTCTSHEGSVVSPRPRIPPKVPQLTLCAHRMAVPR